MFNRYRSFSLSPSMTVALDMSILQLSFSYRVVTPLSAALPIEIKFILNSGTKRTPMVVAGFQL